MTGHRLFLQPAIASFVMVAWDFSMDPEWSTVGHAWIWRNGGPYFGVPISNFLGWYLTTYIFYQLFALYLRNQEPPHCPQRHWRLPVLFYAVSALGNLLLAIPTKTAIHIPPMVIDSSGHVWLTSDILGVCLLTSLFGMTPLALIAWLRLRTDNLAR